MLLKAHLPDYLLELYSQPVYITLSLLLLSVLLYIIYYLKFNSPHFLSKGVYEQSKKNLKKPPPPFPNGWFNIARTY